ncbi:MAG: hypothetical protein EZS28_013654 [Streblomastix strix]|uniref:Uncharacterized protein n=1 Tax=Streblomastix strix TaxID=222440 RepID=A0A5J4W8B0_9EUKA|nr:MAG: hypothetical protein EZS28_013654 [Streblomastix strix]
MALIDREKKKKTKKPKQVKNKDISKLHTENSLQAIKQGLQLDYFPMGADNDFDMNDSQEVNINSEINDKQKIDADLSMSEADSSTSEISSEQSQGEQDNMIQIPSSDWEVMGIDSEQFPGQLDMSNLMPINPDSLKIQSGDELNKEKDDKIEQMRKKLGNENQKVGKGEGRRVSYDQLEDISEKLNSKEKEKDQERENEKIDKINTNQIYKQTQQDQTDDQFLILSPKLDQFESQNLLGDIPIAMPTRESRNKLERLDDTKQQKKSKDKTRDKQTNKEKRKKNKETQQKNSSSKLISPINSGERISNGSGSPDQKSGSQLSTPKKDRKKGRSNLMFEKHPQSIQSQGSEQFKKKSQSFNYKFNNQGNNSALLRDAKNYESSDLLFGTPGYLNKNSSIESFNSSHSQFDNHFANEFIGTDEDYIRVRKGKFEKKRIIDSIPSMGSLNGQLQNEQDPSWKSADSNIGQNTASNINSNISSNIGSSQISSSIEFDSDDDDDYIQCDTFSDTVFRNQINKAVVEVEWCYENKEEYKVIEILCKHLRQERKVYLERVSCRIPKIIPETEKLRNKSPGFGLKSPRNSKFLTPMQSMRNFHKSRANKLLLKRYVYVFTLLISPICPHWSEHVYNNILQRKGSVRGISKEENEEEYGVQQVLFPTVLKVNDIVLRQNKFLVDTLAEIQKCVDGKGYAYKEKMEAKKERKRQKRVLDQKQSPSKLRQQEQIKDEENKQNDDKEIQKELGVFREKETLFTQNQQFKVPKQNSNLSKFTSSTTVSGQSPPLHKPIATPPPYVSDDIKQELFPAPSKPLQVNKDININSNNDGKEKLKEQKGLLEMMQRLWNEEESRFERAIVTQVKTLLPQTNTDTKKLAKAMQFVNQIQMDATVNGMGRSAFDIEYPFEECEVLYTAERLILSQIPKIRRVFVFSHSPSQIYQQNKPNQMIPSPQFSPHTQIQYQQYQNQMQQIQLGQYHNMPSMSGMNGLSNYGIMGNNYSNMPLMGMNMNMGLNQMNMNMNLGMNLNMGFSGQIPMQGGFGQNYNQGYGMGMQLGMGQNQGFQQGYNNPMISGMPQLNQYQPYQSIQQQPQMTLQQYGGGGFGIGNNISSNQIGPITQIHPYGIHGASQIPYGNFTSMGMQNQVHQQQFIQSGQQMPAPIGSAGTIGSANSTQQQQQNAQQFAPQSTLPLFVIEDYNRFKIFKEENRAQIIPGAPLVEVFDATDDEIAQLEVADQIQQRILEQQNMYKKQQTHARMNMLYS